MSAIDPRSYVRKPFVVDAVRVDDRNMVELAEWCRGEILEDTDHRSYILVDVKNPINERQTKAFAGDWILAAGRGFKVYTNAAFVRSYEMANPTSGNTPTPQNVFTDGKAINTRELGDDASVVARATVAHGTTHN